MERILGIITFVVCLISAALTMVFYKPGWSVWMFGFVAALLIFHHGRNEEGKINVCWEEIWRPGIGMFGKLFFLTYYYCFLVIAIILKMRGY